MFDQLTMQLRPNDRRILVTLATSPQIIVMKNSHGKLQSFTHLHFSVVNLLIKSGRVRMAVSTLEKYLPHHADDLELNLLLGKHHLILFLFLYVIFYCLSFDFMS